MSNFYERLAINARKLLFEDTYQLYSTEDQRAGSQFVGPTEDDASTLGEELPIDPSKQMATQLSVDEPPVDDPQYEPANAIELGRALAVLAKSIPEDKVVEIYRKVSAFIDKIEKTQIELAPTEEETEIEIIESNRSLDVLADKLLNQLEKNLLK